MRDLRVQIKTYCSGSFWKVAGLLMSAALLGLAAPALGADERKPNVYVPYRDLAHLVDPADKAVLMDRAAFEALLEAAEANARQTPDLSLGQVSEAAYSGKVSGDQLALTGELKIVSMGRGPIAVPLRFGGIGLSRVTLDGSAAPLGMG